MDDPNDLIASKMNGLPKYVASNSLKAASWGPATILSGDIAARVADLKENPGRELQIHGSGRLAHSLLTAGLIDEFRLVVAPVVLGQGRKLFLDGTTPAGFKLVNVEATPGGLAVHVYQKAAAPVFETFDASAAWR